MKTPRSWAGAARTPSNPSGDTAMSEIGPVLWLLVAATFLVFFQAFMIAPLIPRLAGLFHSSTALVGGAVPAYLVPYGVMTLVWGPLSNRIGRGRVILGSLAAFVALTALTALATGASAFLVARFVTAVGASGIVPIALALIGDRVPYAERGRALGWLFGAMAGGIAFGSSAGALLEPVVGWRGLFLGVAVLALVVLAGLVPKRTVLGWERPAAAPSSFGRVVAGYRALLSDGRARRTYAYVLLNAVLHSGIYTWLGLYFQRRFGLGEVAIGLALLGYGVPGFLFGPVIGRLADRRGRARLIPVGLALGGASALVLALRAPIGIAAVTVTVLSLGYDLTQPLLAGIVTHLSGNRGQAMALNVFTLFVGFGLGSLLFQALLTPFGFSTALVIFGAGATAAAALAVPFFATETSPTADGGTQPAEGS
jgi:predicted MFS family arabinose efflux permease